MESQSVTIDDRADGKSKALLFGGSADWPEWLWRSVYDGCPGSGGGQEPRLLLLLAGI